MGETRFNSSDLQFEVVCIRKHYINAMSVNQISVFFREVGETNQYYFQDAVQFFIESNAEKDNLLTVLIGVFDNTTCSRLSPFFGKIGTYICSNMCLTCEYVSTF